MADELRMCNCIGLHDFELENIKWKEWFEYSLSIFRKHNLEPMRLGVSGTKYRETIKTLTFKGGLKKLESCNFEGIHNLCFMVMEDKDDYTVDFIIDASLYPKPNNPKCSHLSFCIDEKLEPFIQNNFEGMAADFFEFTKAKYGYYYSRILKHYPSAYVTGGNSDYPSPEDKQRCRLWEKAAVYHDGDYKTGDLRDIYKLNFLSHEHLVRDIRPADQHFSGAPITLEAWINSSPEHGELKQLREGFWSWYVPDEHIESVRNALIPSGIILCV